MPNKIEFKLDKNKANRRNRVKLSLDLLIVGLGTIVWFFVFEDLSSLIPLLLSFVIMGYFFLSIERFVNQRNNIKDQSIICSDGLIVFRTGDKEIQVKLHQVEVSKVKKKNSLVDTICLKFYSVNVWVIRDYEHMDELLNLLIEKS